ncbi:MAG: FliI/YscN family ATPase [Planctomycetia bacterium]|nr:FliI/YscN family ATPase [Planctomycetia bacterium]
MNPLDIADQIRSIITTDIVGSVVETTGVTVSAAGFAAPIGAMAEIRARGEKPIPAEVVGFQNNTAILFPYAQTHGVRHGDEVRLVRSSLSLSIGDHVLGNVLDAQGNILDYDRRSADSLKTTSARRVPFCRRAPKAHERPRITQTVATGIRAIDALLTLGAGQRVGIFAGSGVGKSVLLGMIARYTSADVIVIGLIGERGREVNDFIERDLGENGLKRSVLVVATSDEPAIVRVRAAQTATVVAEYFRDQGKNVLLLMDSLTRFALAQREIGLASGEPAGRGGYPPSVFALLPPLVERAGRTQNGDITAIYTVLVEGDDENEPIADAVRGLLDGHIWLSRKLAQEAHYPAIDIPRSISRLMNDICPGKQCEAANYVREMIATWREYQDIVAIGAYRKGTNRKLDLALEKREQITRFLRQKMNESSTPAQTIAELEAISGVATTH